MPSESQALRHRCRCGGSLGYFTPVEVNVEGDVFPRHRDLGRHWAQGLAPGEKAGPRTGTGLYQEDFEGRVYVRIIHSRCGRNEKIPATTYTHMMIRKERGEPVVYL